MTGRKKVHADEAIQGELLFRAIVYWFFCVTVISLLVFACSILSGPPRPFGQVVRESLIAGAPVVFGAVILLPVVLIDVLRVSNRFVGPIHQVKNVLRQVVQGQPSDRVYLREGDFWQSLANDTNLIADALEASQPQEDEEDDFEVEEDVPCTDTTQVELNG